MVNERENVPVLFFDIDKSLAVYKKNSR